MLSISVVNSYRIFLFLVKNTDNKDENFLMLVRKFPQPPLIPLQVGNWAPWFCSLLDFPGRLCQEYFILKVDTPASMGWQACGIELTQKASGSQTWASISFNPHPCLGQGQKSAFISWNQLLHDSSAGSSQTHFQKWCRGWIAVIGFTHVFLCLTE